eukprot:scaffold6882_cov117-Isochrysis_galbana.AAC.3
MFRARCDRARTGMPTSSLTMDKRHTHEIKAHVEISTFKSPGCISRLDTPNISKKLQTHGGRPFCEEWVLNPNSAWPEPFTLWDLQEASNDILSSLQHHHMLPSKQNMLPPPHYKSNRPTSPGYVIARFLTPPRGVGRPPCADPPPSEHEV